MVILFSICAGLLSQGNRIRALYIPFTKGKCQASRNLRVVHISIHFSSCNILQGEAGAVYMDQEVFVRKKSPAWEKLHTLTMKMRKGGPGALSPEALMSFSSLYRRVCADLAYARTHGYDMKLLEFLNGSVGRAYAELYRDEPFTIQQIIDFYAYGFPYLVRKEWSVILLAFIFFITAASSTFLLVYGHPEYAGYFLDEHYIQSMERNAGESQGIPPLTVQEMSAMSHQIMTNNITVGIKAFATGIFFGLGTIFILLQNGALLGALSALCAIHGKNLEFWSLILPHGVIELTAIFICGGAGFLLARWLVDPGITDRRRALKIYGLTAARLMMGVLYLFVMAALVEGFFTPLPINPWYKISFSFFIGILLILYFVIVEKRGRGKV
jgi:uncharacterized membrane protein SpoIIM required for sporulation